MFGSVKAGWVKRLGRVFVRYLGEWGENNMIHALIEIDFLIIYAIISCTYTLFLKFFEVVRHFRKKSYLQNTIFFCLELRMRTLGFYKHMFDNYISFTSSRFSSVCSIIPQI